MVSLEEWSLEGDILVIFTISLRLKSGFIRVLTFGGNGLIRRVVSWGGHFSNIYYLITSEIWRCEYNESQNVLHFDKLYKQKWLISFFEKTFSNFFYYSFPVMCNRGTTWHNFWEKKYDLFSLRKLYKYIIDEPISIIGKKNDMVFSFSEKT